MFTFIGRKRGPSKAESKQLFSFKDFHVLYPVSLK